MSFADRIRETVTFTGTKGPTADITLPGSASTGYDPFSRRYTNGTANIPVVIAHRTADEWQACLCTYTTTNTLTVNSIVATSDAADAAVNFSNGDKDIYVSGLSTSFLPPLTSGQFVVGNASNVPVAVAPEVAASRIGIFDCVKAFSNQIDVEGATINSSIDHIRTAGYYQAGDGGGALYKRVSGTPASPSNKRYITSSGSVYWDIAEAEPNVRQFGAKGDDSTDDQAAIQDAVNYVSSGALYFPTGTYRVGTAVDVAASPRIYGSATRGGTVIKTTSATANIFRVTSASANSPGAKFSNLTFASSVTRSGGHYIRTETANGVTVEWCFFSAPYSGVGVTGSSAQSLRVSNCEFDAVIQYGIEITAATGSQGIVFSNIDNCVITGAAGASAASGLYITNVGDITLNNVHTLYCKSGVKLAVGAGGRVQALKAANCWFDSGLSTGTAVDDGWLIQASGATAVIDYVSLVNCWVATKFRHGYMINAGSSGVINKVELIGCCAAGCDDNGVYVPNAAAKNISIIGGVYAQNSAGSGIAIEAGVSDFRIIGADFGASGQWTANNVGINIVAGASDRYVIAHNTVRGNTVAQIADGGTGTDKITSPNFGSDGEFKAEAFYLKSVLSPAQITSNTDNYNPSGLSTASALRLTTDASRNLTGIAGGVTGRVLMLYNVGSNNLVLKDDVTSTAANRFQLDGDYTLYPDSGVALWYDGTSSRWRVAGQQTSRLLSTANTWTAEQTSEKPWVSSEDIGDAWHFSSGAAAGITLANGATYAFAAGSGLLLLSNSTDGTCALYMVGGATITKIAGDAQYVTTFAPAANEIGIGYDSSLYKVKNNKGASRTLHIMGIKVRDSV